MRRLIVLAIVLSTCLPLAAQYRGHSRPSGYYFRPSRNTLYLRPDYVFQPHYGIFGNSGYGFGYGSDYNHSYGGCWDNHRHYRSHTYASPGWAYGIPGFWAQGDRGAYSTYLMSPGSTEVVRSNTSDLVFKVTPGRALVFVDGKLIGSAADFATERDRYMVLDGRHQLRIEHPGYRPYHAELDVQANRTIHLDVELTKTDSR